MPRPRVRTAALTNDEVAEVRRLFGTVTNAYERLMPTGLPLRERAFKEVASGRPVKPADLAAFRTAIRDWKRTNLK